MGKIIELSNVNKSFNKKVILNNINLSISSGEIVGLQGDNASGKTVLMKLICGLYRANSGEIFVNDKKIGKEVDFPQNIGIATKDFNFPEYLTGLEILENISMIKNRITKNDIISTMNLVGLDYKDLTLYKNFSLGMRQRLNLAQAIMENQSIILLDEIFNGIDDETYCQFVNILKKLKSENRTIILTTHVRLDVYNLCDIIYKINNGSIENI